MKAQACLNLSRMYVDTGDMEKAKETLAQVSEAPTALQNDIHFASPTGWVMGWLQTLGFIWLSTNPSVEEGSHNRTYTSRL